MTWKKEASYATSSTWARSHITLRAEEVITRNVPVSKGPEWWVQIQTSNTRPMCQTTRKHFLIIALFRDEKNEKKNLEGKWQEQIQEIIELPGQVQGPESDPELKYTHYQI